jgi:hypothetical protein
MGRAHLTGRLRHPRLVILTGEDVAAQPIVKMFGDVGENDECECPVRVRNGLPKQPASCPLSLR